MPRYSDKKKEMIENMMRDDIFATAKEIMLADGIKGLTMERIAKEMEISRSTLYNYFSDWHDLICFIEDRIVDPIEKAVDEILNSQTPTHLKLQRIGEVIFRHFAGQKELSFALFEIKNSREGTHKVYEFEKRNLFVQKLTDHFREGIAEGVYRSKMPQVMAEVYFGALSFIFESSIFRGELVKMNEFVAQFTDLISNGFFVNSLSSMNKTSSEEA